MLRAPLIPFYLDLKSNSEDEFYVDSPLDTSLSLPTPITLGDESRESIDTIRKLSYILLVERTNKLVSDLALTPIHLALVGYMVIKISPILDGYSHPQKFQ